MILAMIATAGLYGWKMKQRRFAAVDG